jgi:hypothetical protein
VTRDPLTRKNYLGYLRKSTYYRNEAYFSWKGLQARNLLREFYYHLLEKKGFEMHVQIEEKEANCYARVLLKNCS